MSVLHRGFLTVAAAAAFAVPSLAPNQQATAPAPVQAQSAHTGVAPQAVYTPDALEFYLANDTVGYIRPGLKIKVNSITIGTDRKPVVDLSITDDLNQPLDRLGQTTPGAVSISMILAWYDPATRHYTSYTTRTQTTPPTSPHPGVTAIQAGTDSAGAAGFTDLETGHSKYTFRTVLPADFDKTKTTTLGIYSTRNLTDILGKNYYVNVLTDFRPDGGTVTDKWEKANEATSCNRCHNPLAAHGGSRQAVKLCALCHQPQTVDPDTGNTVDMKVMAHKIHMGEHLPSVVAGTPYQIIGFQQSVNDYSTVAWPGNNNRAPYDCATCHEAAQPQGSVWYTQPSAAACGSCHDDVNFTTGANHPAGPAADSTCASCHKPQGDAEFDASIKGAHTIPESSTQLKGLTATIVSVTNATPGNKPTVVFKLKNTDGTAVDGTKLSTFAPILGGNTASYGKPYWREDARSKAIFDAAAGTTTYTFQNAIPAGSKGTWVVSADIYRNVNLVRGDGKPDIALREAAMNPIQYVSVDGKPVVERRKSVDLAKCNVCHVALALHGGQRRTTEECVICHNPAEDDTSRRPSTAGLPESVSMQRLVHRIHTGEELSQDFTVYGFYLPPNPPNPVNYNEVRFPGDRRDCVKCHVSLATITPPLSPSIASVNTQRDYFAPQGPATASCLGCHDSRDAAAHAYINTAPFGEACGTCHASGADWDVAKVHAR